MLRNSLLIVAACGFCVSPPSGMPSNASLQKEVERLRIPEKLVPRQKQPLFMVRAEGVQIYEAKEKDGAVQWVFQAPQATLMDYVTGEKIGAHSKGPTWVDNDGSKLTGTMIASEAAPNADAIPWLLLEVKNENGGRYSKVTNIQRVDTWAGRAPGAAPTKAGETKEVRYQATYVLWGDL